MVSNRTPYPNPLQTKYEYTVYLFIQGRRERGEFNQRERDRGDRGEYRSQSWVENTNVTECTREIFYPQSINSDKYLPQSPFTYIFLREKTETEIRLRCAEGPTTLYPFK
jgi:hypothetical protein